MFGFGRANRDVSHKEVAYRRRTQRITEGTETNESSNSVAFVPIGVSTRERVAERNRVRAAAYAIRS